MIESNRLEFSGGNANNIQPVLRDIKAPAGYAIPDSSMSVLPSEEHGSAMNQTVYPGSGSANSQLVNLAPPRPTPTVDLALVLAEIQVKLSEQGINTSKEDVRIIGLKNEALHEERLKASQAASEAMANARRSGVFGKVFGWMAAAATMVAGAAMIATGAGAVAGGIMMALAVDQFVGMATGKSGMTALTSKLAEGLSFLGEPANSITASILVGAVVIIGTVGAGIYGSAGSTAGKAASTATNANAAASTAGQVASTATSSGASTTLQASAAAARTAASVAPGATATAAANTTTFQQALVNIRNMGLLFSAGAQIGGGTASIGAALHTKKGADATVEKVEIQKVLTQNQAYIERAFEHIESLMENIEGTLSHMVDFTNQTMDTHKRLVRNFA